MRKRKAKQVPYVPSCGFLKDRPTPRITPKSAWLIALEEQQKEQGVLHNNVRQIRTYVTPKSRVYRRTGS